MTKSQIIELFMEKKRKKLTNKSLAEAIGCSPSLLSHFFNCECNLSEEKLRKLKQLINQAKEYKWQRVPID